ncbi:MAG: hypothetical protein F4016_06025 [Acidimicrobiaceae bacterium]|nr:hypothetical protein [Acidimicrobiaceae bacterium]
MTDKTPHIRRIAPAGSLLQQLEMIVESDVVGDLAEQLEAFHQSRGHAGRRHQYTFMDILVTSAAAQLCGSDREAIRVLDDPSMWEWLRNAAAATFPGDLSRRLSPRAPSRYQLYRARRSYFSGDALEVLKRGLRAAAVRAAADLGAFDPSTGTWTHPDKSQCVVGDATWIPASARRGKGPNKRYLSTGDSGNGPRPVDGRELVVLSCRGSSDSECMVLDAELSDGAVTARNDADRAAAMLRRLLDEHGDTLRPGLRGLLYDMAMTSDTVDKVLDMGILPITRVPRSSDGGHQSVSFGTCPFTGVDGTEYDHDVVAINGAPAVVLTDSDGDKVAVPLSRKQIRWENSGSRHVAYGHYAMPHTPPVPTHLRGASTVIRLNSLDSEARSRKRRTRALRAIPEGDAGVDHLYGTREGVESTLADLKSGAGRIRGSRNIDFQIVVCQMLSIVRAIAARHTQGKGRSAPRAA